MSFGLYRFTRANAATRATVSIAPNNAAFSVSDFSGTITQDASKIRLTRSIVDGQGFEHCAPNARVRFTVTNATYSHVLIKLNYTSLVTRLDTYNGVGSVLIDGALSRDFDGPKAHVSGQPHPSGIVNVLIKVASGAHLIEVVMPYCASVDFVGVDIAATASISAASARVSKRGVFFGDSITHGFHSSRIRAHWPSLVAATELSQIINYGYGGRQLEVADGTTAGAMGCDYAVYLIGFNNFLPGGGSTTTFKNNYKTLLGNFRTASTAAGKPSAKFYAITPFDAPSATGSGAFAANSPTLEAFRQAIRDAITEQADANVVLVEGLAGGMPTGTSNFPDGIHPNDAASAVIAPIISGVIA